LQHILVIRLLHITKNIQSDTESTDLQVKMYAATGTGNVIFSNSRKRDSLLFWQSPK